MLVGETEQAEQGMSWRVNCGTRRGGQNRSHEEGDTYRNEDCTV